MNKIKLLFILTAIAIFGAIAYSFYETVIAKETIVLSGATCDPETEGPCYIWVCEPSWWDECSGDPEEDIWTYKMVQKKAADMPACIPGATTEGFLTKVVDVYEPCPEQECAEGDPTCEVIYCDPETEAEYCYDETQWEEYVTMLHDGVAAACDDKIGDYKGAPDYCALLEEMDAAAEEDVISEDEAGVAEEKAEEDITVEEEITEE